jgi:hypothetical protein
MLKPMTTTKTKAKATSVCVSLMAHPHYQPIPSFKEKTATTGYGIRRRDIIVSQMTTVGK